MNQDNDTILKSLPHKWPIYRKVKRGFYMMRRLGPQYRKNDFAFFIDAISWDDKEYGDIFGPDKVNYAHHRLIKIKHFRYALDGEWHSTTRPTVPMDRWIGYQIAERKLINARLY